MMTPICLRRALPLVCAVSFLLAAIAAPGHAGKAAAKPEAKPEAKPDAHAAPAKPAATLGNSLGSMGSGASGFLRAAGIELPDYVEPPAYSVDLVIHSADTDEMVLKRFVDGGKIRTDLSSGGQDFSMIELGDEKGTSYTVVPEQKMVIKQSRQALDGVAKKLKVEPEAKQEAVEVPASDFKVEDLGDETVRGHVAKKIRMSGKDGSALGWFDKATGAPLKMESTNDGKTSSIEWRDMKAGAQPAKLYELPKGYEITDMDEMMAKMKNMSGGGGALGGLAGMAGMGGMAGMPGMAGMGGGLNGMAGGMGANFGSQMGSQFGSALGASLGGPLGAMAGNYIGGKVGGMIGRKTAQAIVPGK